MAVDLVELDVKTLLEKFGRGSHKPGSGSAAALQGMLAAQLILTVTSLTLVKKISPSKARQFNLHKHAIENRIYPRISKRGR